MITLKLGICFCKGYVMLAATVDEENIIYIDNIPIYVKKQSNGLYNVGWRWHSVSSEDSLFIKDLSNEENKIMFELLFREVYLVYSNFVDKLPRYDVLSVVFNTMSCWNEGDIDYIRNVISNRFKIAEEYVSYDFTSLIDLKTLAYLILKKNYAEIANLKKGKELFNEGKKSMDNYYDRASNYCPIPIHSYDYHKSIVNNYYLPAAEYGYLEAYKELAEYYDREDPLKANMYRNKYLEKCNNPFEKRIGKIHNAFNIIGCLFD